MTKIAEKFPGDEHRQIYYMWREYPLGSKLTLACGFVVGFGLATIIGVAML